MKRMTYFVMALALVLGLAQCKKEQPLEPTNEDNVVRITLEVENGGDNGSRANVNPPHVTFENDDQILVASGGHYVGALTRENNIFSGGIDGDKVVSGQPLYFYFLGNNAVLGTADGDGNINGCTVDISDQRNYPHLPVISMGKSTVNYSSSVTSYSSKLYNKASLMKFNVVTASDAATCITGMNNKVTVYFGLDKVAEEGTGLGDDATNHGFKYEKDGAGIIKMKGAYGSVQTPAVKWAIVLPQSALGAGETGSAYSEDGKYSSTRPAMAAIPCNQYLDGGVDLTVGRLIDLSGLDGDYTLADGDVVTGTLAGNYQISIASGATVTLRNANITSLTDADYAGITCDNDATIILEGTNTVVGGLSDGWGDYPGIFIAEDHTLTIDGTGTLYAKCGALDEGYGDACGIGGGYDLHCGNINIQGGTIIATGGEFHAGIGGGDTEENDDAIRCGDITISGGTVTATGGENAAGIGSGNQGSCGDITISGGTVTAIGGENAAGIGSGSSGTCGDIKINDGTVTATGGADATGIGSGGSGRCGDISISGGTVTATGGANAAGIGSGYIGTCGDITITSGVTRVTATKGTGAPNSIGAGRNGYCGTVEIGGTVYYQNNAYVGTGSTYLTQSPLIYPTPTPSAPTGAINGLFSVSATQQVYFSQGNLQYIGSAATPYWKFADNQWDYLGNNGQDSDSETANRDLFGWGTSGYNHGAVAYQPWSTSTSSNDYYAYGAYTNNLYDQTGQADWGYNAISNGGNVENCGWRTLTKDEWEYLFNNHINGRTTLTDVNVPGWMILPDGASGSIATSYSTSTLPAGALFLPAAGYRDGTVVFDGGGSYWSSTPDDDVNARSVYFYDDNVDPGFYDWLYSGLSVRLVRNAE
jgi:hypothetical protein